MSAQEELQVAMRAVDSHADGLRLFGDLPEAEEQADMLGLLQ